MEEKSKNKKEQPITKFEAKKKVDELKKNSQANKKINDSETRRILEKVEEIKIENEKSEGLTEIFKKIGNFFASLLLSFEKLETSIKLCIIIPLLVFLIIIGNRVYSTTGTEYLTCTYSNTSPILVLNQELKVEFKRNAIYKVIRTTKYTEQNENWKSVEDLEKETLEKIEENKKVKGFSVNYEKTDTEFTVVEDYNYYKLSDKDLKNFNLESELSLEEMKKEYEDFGYECKSSK